MGNESSSDGGDRDGGSDMSDRCPSNDTTVGGSFKDGMNEACNGCVDRAADAINDAARDAGRAAGEAVCKVAPDLCESKD